MVAVGASQVVAGPLHGPYPSIVLQNARLRVVAVPMLGAKVVSLVDRVTEREWLTQGQPPKDSASPEALFGASAAYGWDECLPTVAPGPDPVVVGGRLRDHGDAWGRPTELTVLGGALETWTAGLGWSYGFRRSLSLDGSVVVAHYAIVNREPAGGRTLPFLWAMHPLLDLEPGARISLPAEVREVVVSQAAGVGIEAGANVAWPVAAPSRGLASLRLDEVRPIDAGEALKLYAGPLTEGRAAVEAIDGSSLTIAWDVAVAPFLGLWLDYGGWPSTAPLQQVALEPTTAPSDGLSEAIADNRARWLAPGERVDWTVRIEVGDD